jgi:hypothetical protein
MHTRNALPPRGKATIVDLLKSTTFTAARQSLIEDHSWLHFSAIRPRPAVAISSD